MNNSFLVLGLAGILALGTAAEASNVRVDYSFEVTDTFGGFPAPVAVSGTAFYDLTSVDLSPLPAQGIYSLLSHSVSFGGVPRLPTANESGVFVSEIRFEDQVPFTPPRDRIVLLSTFNFETGDVRVGGIGFTLEGPGSAFTGDDPFVPDVSDFTVSTSGFVTFENLVTGGNFATSAPLTIEFALVRSPPGVLLLVSGVAALYVAARGRRRRRGVIGGRDGVLTYPS